jgi:cytoskeleton protein RodZ
VEAAAESTAPPPAGQLLAAERERQGLSRVEIAQRLHMSPWQVEALEMGDYSRLPKGPFLRGFVRNYAKALALDPDAILASVAQATPAEGAPRIVVPSQNIRFDPLGERLSGPYVRAGGLAAVVIALSFAAMYWWLFIRPAPPATHKAAVEAPRPVPAAPATSEAQSQPQTQAPVEPQAVAAPARTSPTAAAPVPAPAAPAVPAQTPAKAQAAPAKAEERKAEAKPAAAPAPAKGEAVLQFRFDGDSWVEVRDSGDKVVFQRLNPADSEATVTGKLPLRVIVGNAGEVSMRYNGREFPLEPHTKVAVARFTLE